MTQMLHILEEFTKELEKSNPFHLVLKGGTALSLYHLRHHRESEDLDFDAPLHQKKNIQQIEDFFVNILSRLKNRDILQEYRITKAELASTERYHIKLELKTHKTFTSKIDVDFVELPANLLSVGELYLYSAERMFITKAVTFIRRKEFKDLYDVIHLLSKVDISKLKNANVQELLQNIVQILQKEDVIAMYKAAFRNVDLRFKNVKAGNVVQFVKEAQNKLWVFINKLDKIVE